MPPSARIAVLERERSELPDQLAELAIRPEVRSFGDLYEDFEALRRFAPRILFVAGESITEADLGALRLVERAIPGVATVLVVPREREVEFAATADSLGAQLLLRPFGPTDLSAVVDGGRHGGAPATPSTFLDLARGISDEVNNPLLFAAGHLQLLEAMLDERADRSPLAQIGAIREGLDRIAATMGKIRMLGEARAGRGTWRPLRLAALLREAAEPALGAPAIPADLEDVEILGEASLLRAAFLELCAVGGELAQRADRASLTVEKRDDALRIRLVLTGLDLPDWQLPRAFEPYYLNRILRGTAHGLGLFLVQTVVHAHRGLATARRCADGTVAFDLLLHTDP